MREKRWEGREAVEGWSSWHGCKFGKQENSVMNLVNAFTSESKHCVFMKEDGTLWNWGTWELQLEPVEVHVSSAMSRTPSSFLLPPSSLL
jgi:hypothetical protein